jgi:hypothetical protein
VPETVVGDERIGKKKGRKKNKPETVAGDERIGNRAVAAAGNLPVS